MTSFKGVVPLGLLALGFALVAGCSNGGNSSNSSGGGTGAGSSVKLTGSGSSFIKPAMEKWASKFHEAKGGRINYQGGGSGAGVTNMIDRSQAFGCTDAYMNEEQLKKAKEAKDGGEVIHIPLAMGGIVPAYNLEGLEKPVNFTGEILAEIYMGKIKKWNDPKLVAVNAGAKLPDKDIAVCRRGDPSGSTAIFTDFLAKVHPEFKNKIGSGTKPDWTVGTAEKETAGVAGFVKNAAFSLGYIELTYALQNKIAFGAVKNVEGEFILADLESVSKAAANSLKEIPDDLRYSITNAPGQGSYPIGGTTWAVMYVKQPGDQGKQLAQFFRWIIHDGQPFAKELHYAPLPEGLVKRADEKLKLLEQ
jgi:phosphate ABC transporter phosphate-binding protein